MHVPAALRGAESTTTTLTMQGQSVRVFGRGINAPAGVISLQNDLLTYVHCCFICRYQACFLHMVVTARATVTRRSIVEPKF